MRNRPYKCGKCPSWHQRGRIYSEHFNEKVDYDHELIDGGYLNFPERRVEKFLSGLQSWQKSEAKIVANLRTDGYTIFYPIWKSAWYATTVLE